MSDRLHIPTDKQTLGALRLVGEVLDVDCARVADHSYWFVVGECWALGVRPDDAGRFKLRACYGATEVATLWATADDLGRLADLARGFKAEIEALRR